MSKSVLSLISLLSLFILTSCKTNKTLEGLWLVEKVKVGDQEMTPNAKWTRLNADQSQESGNGWKQHSIGTWEIDSESQTLYFVTSNGIKDEFGGFTYEKSGADRMTWSREEEGAEVNIYLKKITKLPQAPADALFGVWQAKDDPEAKSYLFFRWDQILVSKKSNQNRKFGMYKTHGHKPEVQIIYYEDPLRQEVWTYRFKENRDLVLSIEGEGEKHEKVYSRIDYIPR